VEAATALHEEEEFGGDEDTEVSITPKDRRAKGSPPPRLAVSTTALRAFTGRADLP